VIDGERWDLVEWIGVAFRIVPPRWGFVMLWLAVPRVASRLLLTLGFESAANMLKRSKHTRG